MPEINVDQNADRDPDGLSSPAQFRHVVGMVDGDLDVGLALQGGQSRRPSWPDHQVSDQDVGDAAGGHHLRLRYLGDGHPDRARLAQACERSPGT